jgi:hypothetical protein
MCSEPSAAVTCVFDVQQNSQTISETRHRAARCAAHRAACSAAFIFNVIFSFLPVFDQSTQKRTHRCVQRDVAFLQRNVALHGLLQCLLHSV